MNSLGKEIFDEIESEMEPENLAELDEDLDFIIALDEFQGIGAELGTTWALAALTETDSASLAITTFLSGVMRYREYLTRLGFNVRKLEGRE